MGDADDSYDFARARRRSSAQLRAGDDLVMGNRFAGGIEPGAMPWLHRYLGNPVLSFLGRLFFRVAVGDFHCGLRGFRTDADRSHSACRRPGMEFASEMVVKATLLACAIAEVPTTLRQDGRSRPPHLRTWRDGWRHLRFLLLYCPAGCSSVRGSSSSLSALVLVWLLPGPRHVGSSRLRRAHAARRGGPRLVGAQAIWFARVHQGLRHHGGPAARGPSPEPAWRFVTLETGLVASASSSSRATALCASVASAWAASGWAFLDYSVSMRRMIPGALLLVLGAHGIFASFFLSILGLRRR